MEWVNRITVCKDSITRGINKALIRYYLLSGGKVSKFLLVGIKYYGLNYELTGFRLS